MGVLSSDDLEEWVAQEINDRPRKRLAFEVASTRGDGHFRQRYCG